MMCYMPTLSLANSIGFEHVTNAQTDFPFIRTFSPLGWIVAGLVVGSLPSLTPAWFGGLTDIEATAIPFKLSAMASFFMGAYAFTLPHTPPKSLGQQITFADIAGLKTLALMKDPSFAVFVVCSLLLCIPTAFYFQSAAVFFTSEGMTQTASTMVLAQVSDVVFLAIMPMCLARLGIKGIILTGLTAWVLRYGLFAAGAGHRVMWPYYVGILVHGMCYDFFFLAGQIYVDQRAPREVRSNAQGFIALVTLGIGMTIGNILNGYVKNWVTTGSGATEVVDWQTLWLVPAAIAAVVGLAFLALFREKTQSR